MTSTMNNNNSPDKLERGSPREFEPEAAGSDSGTLIVDWDGPDDPANPKNWAYRRKWMATIIISAFTFTAPLASSMIAPATDQIAAEFGIKSTVVQALVTSIFVMAFAIGPLFLGPLSEIYGRSIVIQVANIFFLVWNIACGFAQNTTQLIVFRFLAGLGGSAPLSIGGGAISDLWSAEQRGKAIAIYSLAPLMGPVLGPIIGAWIAQKSVWRWVFWSISIFDVVLQIAGLFLLQETFAPLLLERKAKRVRAHMHEKSISDSDSERAVRTVYEGENRRWKHIFGKALTRPFLIFAREPIVQVLGVYMAFVYGLLYLFLTTIPSTFQGVYGQHVGVAGLHYVALGIGLTGASQVNARLMDRIYRYLTKKNGVGGKPEYRLPSMVPATILLPAGLLLTGWSVQYKIHWIVPDIGLVLVGAGMILNFQSIQVYIVDTFALFAASGLAATTCLRSLAGFGFPLFAPTMYASLGYGKGDTILACCAIAIGCPAPWLLWIYGERLRKASRYSKK